MRPRAAQFLILLLAACSTRQAVLPPPAPTAPAAPSPPAAIAPADPTRQAEENIERVDISALQTSGRKAEITPAPDLVSLKVRVVDSEGRPAVGTMVVLRTMVGGKEQRVSSGADGVVVFRSLPGGDYVLSTDPAELAETIALPLRLEPGKEPDSIVIRLLGAQPHGGTGSVGMEETLSRPQFLA